MDKRRFLTTALAAATVCAFSAGAHAQQWKPNKPINLIVPWAAGGSTDAAGAAAGAAAAAARAESLRLRFPADDDAASAAGGSVADLAGEEPGGSIVRGFGRCCVGCLLYT